MSSAADNEVTVLATLRSQRRALQSELARVDREIAETQTELDHLKDRLNDQGDMETRAA